jgi:hypothetical protein
MITYLKKNDEDDDNDEMDTLDIGGGTSSVPLVMARLRVMDLVEDGWKKLDQMNIGKVWLVANKQA